MKSGRLGRRLLVSIFLFIAACASGPKPPAKSAAGELDAKAPSIFLWHATREGAPGELYLLGSMHIQKPEIVLDRAITETAKGCERVAFELDFDNVDQNEVASFMQKHAMLPEGKTLKDVIAPELYTRWVKVTRELELSAAGFEKMQPWMATMLLQLTYMSKHGFDSEHGIDRLLQTFAAREPSKKREVIALESPTEQLELLKNSGEPVQEAMLRDALRSIETGESDQLAQLYEQGDAAGLAQIFDASRSDPSIAPFIEALIDRRNERMEQKLLPLFDKPGCTFVTVGAGHLVGQTGLVALLTGDHLRVEAVPGRGPSSAELMAYTVPAKAKAYLSEGDHFSAVMGGKPMTQELPLPDAPSLKLRSYTVTQGMSTVLSIAVIESATPPEDLRAALESSALAGITRSQLKPSAPEQITLDGQLAVRVSGTEGQGSVGYGKLVAAQYGNAFYVLSGFALGKDPEAKARSEQAFDNMVASFRFLPATPPGVPASDRSSAPQSSADH